jgi:hypothetical protein
MAAPPCGADLGYSQKPNAPYNGRPSCFCGAARARRTAKFTATGAWWKTGAWSAGGWCNATCSTSARLTTSKRRRGAAASRSSRRANPGHTPWRGWPPNGRVSRRWTRPSSRFGWTKWNCAGPGSGAAAGWPASCTTNWNWMRFSSTPYPPAARERALDLILQTLVC